MHKNLSSRSELLVQARGKISNPFLLCAVIGERTRELMMGPNKGNNILDKSDRKG